MSTRRIIRTQRLILNDIKHVTIGDPMYFDEIQKAPKENKHLRKLVADFAVRKIYCCKALVTEFEEEYRGITVNTVELHVAGGYVEEVVDTYLADRWYGEDTVRERHELGCDTAEFIIDLRTHGGKDLSDVIHTGADGYYGQSTKYKEGLGFEFTLSLDADYVPFEDVVEIIRTIEKKQTNIGLRAS